MYLCLYLCLRLDLYLYYHPLYLASQNEPLSNSMTAPVEPHHLLGHSFCQSIRLSIILPSNLLFRLSPGFDYHLILFALPCWTQDAAHLPPCTLDLAAPTNTGDVIQYYYSCVSSFTGYPRTCSLLVLLFGQTLPHRVHGGLLFFLTLSAFLAIIPSADHIPFLRTPSVATADPRPSISRPLRR